LPRGSEEYHEYLGEAGSFRAQGRSGSRLQIERIARKQKESRATLSFYRSGRNMFGIWNMEYGVWKVLPHLQICLQESVLTELLITLLKLIVKLE
jgi:hypothetical protein